MTEYVLDCKPEGDDETILEEETEQDRKERLLLEKFNKAVIYEWTFKIKNRN